RECCYTTTRNKDGSPRHWQRMQGEGHPARAEAGWETSPGRNAAAEKTTGRESETVQADRAARVKAEKRKAWMKPTKSSSRKVGKAACAIHHWARWRGPDRQSVPVLRERPIQQPTGV
ncbi:unnamed protein product, partial [Pylaiella littoralis]